MITKKEFENLVKNIIQEADYDLYKQLDPVTAEEPGEAEEFLARLVEVAEIELEDYVHDLKFLNALQCAGVDNWDGYDYAQDYMEE